MWGLLGMGGQGHINNHAESYLVRKITALGYRVSDWRARYQALGRADGESTDGESKKHQQTKLYQQHANYLNQTMFFERISPIVPCPREPPPCARTGP